MYVIEAMLPHLIPERTQVVNSNCCHDFDRSCKIVKIQETQFARQYIMVDLIQHA